MPTAVSTRTALAQLRAAREPLSLDRAGPPEGNDAADAAARLHAAQRCNYWNEVARLKDTWEGWGSAYHARLRHVYRLLIAPGQQILELGCGRGDLLAALEPSRGVGIDLASEMVQRAAQRHPHLTFHIGDAHDINADGPFDVIILSDLANELWDVQTVMERLRPLCTTRTRIIINTYSHLWDWPLAAVARLGLARPLLRQNWLTTQDLSNILSLAGYQTLRNWQEVIWPLRTPILGPALNRYATRIWPLRHLSLANFLIARPLEAHLNDSDRVDRRSAPALAPNPRPRQPTISVIVPARNEAGNIDEILRRIPEMGAGTEIVFVEGHSRDDTLGAIRRGIENHPHRRTQVHQQTGEGKGDAVRLGFERATGDILMILDADLTVAPEQLPRFYEALRANTGEFINGVRLVYPMEDRAMRPLNLLGNKFFGAAFSWLLGQPIRDSLCGTKVLWTDDYRRIAANRACFGEFDPFGDFDLLFGAAKLNLKIVDVPIRYGERKYGTTNIRRFRHGWMLLKMVGFAAGRIKFV